MDRGNADVWGCDETCRADPQGWPAPCFMYPDAKHVGCSRQAEPAPAPWPVDPNAPGPKP